MQIPGEQKSFWLARHVHLCEMQDGVVLLDLKRDKYMGLGGAHMRALASAVNGWPASRSRPDGEQARAEQILEMATKLESQGILTRDPAAGKNAEPVTLAPVDMTWAFVKARVRPRIRLRDVVSFAIAHAAALLALRWSSLESVVERTRARSAKGRCAAQRIAVSNAEELTAIFCRIRSYCYSRNDRCLVDALTLINFLARYGHFPLWVVGVTTRPFRAHSWVQDGARVFDAAPDYICEFTPILAV